MTELAHRVVLLTPPAAGAIAVIRVLGPDAIGLVNQVFRPKSVAPLSADQTNRLRYGQFVDGDEVIDDVVVCVSEHETQKRKNAETQKHRHAETQEADHGERRGGVVVDISAHGGVRVVERILQALERRGVAVCEPFSEIADVWPVRNRIEAEAVEAMCLAKTQRALEFLSWQREHLPSAVESLGERARADEGAVKAGLEAMLAGYPAARRLLHGAVVALVGPPNSGKSTLFNRLLGRPAAIVSPAPGTTRDWIAEAIDVDGVPITLVDTAGRHEAGDALEQLAIDAGIHAAARADLHVLVLDATRSVPSRCTSGLGSGHGDRETQKCRNAETQKHADWPDAPGIPLVTVLNKCDAPGAVEPGEELLISARTGEGVETLLDCLCRLLGLSRWSHAAPCFFTQRQVALGRRAQSLLFTDRALAVRLLQDDLIGAYGAVAKTF